MIAWRGVAPPNMLRARTAFGVRRVIITRSPPRNHVITSSHHVIALEESFSSEASSVPTITMHTSVAMCNSSHPRVGQV